LALAESRQAAGGRLFMSRAACTASCVRVPTRAAPWTTVGARADVEKMCAQSKAKHPRLWAPASRRGRTSSVEDRAIACPGAVGA